GGAESAGSLGSPLAKLCPSDDGALPAPGAGDWGAGFSGAQDPEAGGSGLRSGAGAGDGGVPSETTGSTRTCNPRVSDRARCTCSECPPLLNAEARPPVEKPSCSVLASNDTT